MLVKNHRLQGRNISMDCLYTGIEIARWLLENNITVVGTTQMNRAGIPKELKEVGGRDILRCKVFWEVGVISPLLLML